jgi:hypothetical protein
MSNLDKVLNETKDDAVQDVTVEFAQLLAEAKGSAQAFVRDNAAKVQNWVAMVSSKKIDKDEFDDLIADQKLAAQQFVNMQAIDAQARSQRLTIEVMDMAVTKVVPALLAVAL